MSVTDEFMKSVARDIEAWTEPSYLGTLADEVGLAAADTDEKALARFARRIAIGVAHSMLVTIDNGAALADQHLLSLIEIDATGMPLSGGELEAGLHERVYDYLPDDYLRD